jgi:hypothetical protein
MLYPERQSIYGAHAGGERASITLEDAAACDSTCCTFKLFFPFLSLASRPAPRVLLPHTQKRKKSMNTKYVLARVSRVVGERLEGDACTLIDHVLPSPEYWTVYVHADAGAMEELAEVSCG